MQSNSFYVPNYFSSKLPPLHSIIYRQYHFLHHYFVFLFTSLLLVSLFQTICFDKCLIIIRFGTYISSHINKCHTNANNINTVFYRTTKMVDTIADKIVIFIRVCHVAAYWYRCIILCDLWLWCVLMRTKIRASLEKRLNQTSKIAYMQYTKLHVAITQLRIKSS